MNQKFIKLLSVCAFLSSSLMGASAFAQSDAAITPQSIAGTSQFLGEYVVSQEMTKDSPKTDLCPTQADHPGNNLWCGRKVWIFQDQTQGLILIDAVKSDADGSDMLSTFDIAGKSCKINAFIRDAQSKGIFNVNLCALAAGPVGDTWNANKPTTGGEALVDSVTFIFGLILGSHSSIVTIQDSNASSVLFENIYRTLSIDDKMTLTKTSP